MKEINVNLTKAQKLHLVRENKYGNKKDVYRQIKKGTPRE